MRTVQTIFIPAAIGVMIAAACWAQTPRTYYVSTTGSDDNSGTMSDPWRTIQRAVNSMQPGDTTLVRAGTYAAYVAIGTDFGYDGTPARSGTSQQPISLKAFAGEEVIWQNDLSFPADHAARYEMIYVFQRTNWVIEGFRFVHTAGAPRASTWWGYGIWLEFADATTIRNNVFDGRGTLRPGGVVVNLRRQSDGVLVENNVFVDWPSASDLMGVMLEGNWREISDVSQVLTNHDTIIRSNRMEGLGGDCIQIGEFGGSNTLIEGNTCWMKHNDAVNRATEEFVDVKLSDRTVIRGNVAWGSRPKPTSLGGSAVVIHIGAKDVVVEDNIFFDNTRGIGLGAGSPDFFPSWFQGERSPERISIRRNLFLDIHYKRSWDGIEGTGLCLDASGIKGLEIYHNTFAYCATHAIRLAENEQIDIRNNIFYRTGMQHLWENSMKAVTPPQLLIDYNIFDWSGGFLIKLPDGTFFRGDLGNFRLRTGQCARCWQTDPLFHTPTLEPATADYRLLPGSPAIDAAVVLSGYNDSGFAGAAPDIGKCETGTVSACGVTPQRPAIPVIQPPRRRVIQQ